MHNLPVFLLSFFYLHTFSKIGTFLCCPGQGLKIGIVPAKSGQLAALLAAPVPNAFLRLQSGGAGTSTREPLCLHLNVHTTWLLKTYTPSAYLKGWDRILL